MKNAEFRELIHKRIVEAVEGCIEDIGKKSRVIIYKVTISMCM